jgi:hypothetical protein
MSELDEARRHDNRAAIVRAWRLSFSHVTHALRSGIYQGWDVHGAQIPVRYAANYAFFVQGFFDAGSRLATMLAELGRAQSEGAFLDDVATAQTLFAYVRRGFACGAIDEGDLRSTGLRRGEIDLPSFSAVLRARR